MSDTHIHADLTSVSFHKQSGTKPESSPSSPSSPPVLQSISGCNKRMGAKNESGILCLSLNQDHSLFACATESGLRIYNIEPLMVKSCLEASEVGTIKLVELLDRTNIVALVSGGSGAKYAENTVLVWDDEQKKLLLELTFATPVLAIRMRKDLMFVVEEKRVHAFSFPNDVTRLMTIETRDNPKGLILVSPYASSSGQVLALPGHRMGSVQVLDLSCIRTRDSHRSPLTLPAHQSDVVVMALNQEGSLLATASQTGTLIRVWDTRQGHAVVELRRGADAATLFCLNFSPEADFLCVSSDKGTIHVFAVRDRGLNRRSSLPRILGSYGQSEWALSTFTVAAECPCVCAFGPKNSVFALSTDGSFHKYLFHGDGSRTRDAYDRFLDLTDDEQDF